MNELQSIVRAAREAQKAGNPAILATVVRVRGSAYRRPGARMLLTEAGWQAGSISGGCLEGDVERKAWWRTRTGEPVVVTYDSTLSGGSEDASEAVSWGFGLGCNGIVEVMLERLRPDLPECPITFLDRCLSSGGRSGVMATVIAAVGAGSGVSTGQRLFFCGDAVPSPSADTIVERGLRAQITRDAEAALASGASRSERYPLEFGGFADVFLEVIHPPVPLVICGAGHDAAPLADLASRLGWSVTVADPRPGMTPRADRFPGANRVLACPAASLATEIPLDERTLSVVMSHNVALDAAVLSALLNSPVRYIGMLGPRRRTEQIIDDLKRAASGAPLSGLDRIHGPVGLDIGADNPETIALSILAEMQAVSAGRAGSFLRLSASPIHPPASAAADTNVYSVNSAGADPRQPWHGTEPFACSLLTENSLPTTSA